jgi:hypothetical protein
MIRALASRFLKLSHFLLLGIIKVSSEFACGQGLPLSIHLSTKEWVGSVAVSSIWECFAQHLIIDTVK